MKRVSRAQLRGKPLDDDCRIAGISKHECGPDDQRCFCYGLKDMMTDDLVDKCWDCPAYAMNATPLKEEP